jgi:hypothetical protein
MEGERCLMSALCCSDRIVSAGIVSLAIRLSHATSGCGRESGVVTRGCRFALVGPLLLLCCVLKLSLALRLTSAEAGPGHCWPSPERWDQWIPVSLCAPVAAAHHVGACEGVPAIPVRVMPAMRHSTQFQLLAHSVFHGATPGRRVLSSSKDARAC